jgi:hypothetical protein
MAGAPAGWQAAARRHAALLHRTAAFVPPSSRRRGSYPHTTPQPDSGRERRPDARDKHPRIDQERPLSTRAHAGPPQGTLHEPVILRPSIVDQLYDNVPTLRSTSGCLNSLSPG